MTIKKPIYLTALLGLLAALVAITIAGKAVLGYRVGEIHFTTALNNFELAAYIAVAAVILCLASLWSSRASNNRRGLSFGLLGLLLSLPQVIYITNFEYAAVAYPPINDITTDMEEPPSFWEVPEPVTYPGPEVAKLQQQYYPNLKPLELAMEPVQAHELALVVAQDMGWKIVSADLDELQIEAVATSFLFGFEDYVVVRLQDINDHTRVDVRSRSRLGQIDRGVNAKRIRVYLQTLEQRISSLE